MVSVFEEEEEEEEEEDEEGKKVEKEKGKKKEVTPFSGELTLGAIRRRLFPSSCSSCSCSSASSFIHFVSFCVLVSATVYPNRTRWSHFDSASSDSSSSLFSPIYSSFLYHFDF